MPNAKRLLEEYHFDILKDMAEMLGIAIASNKKAAHVKALTPVLFTPLAVQKGFALLGQREREALAAIQRAKGRVRSNSLRMQLLPQK